MRRRSRILFTSLSYFVNSRDEANEKIPRANNRHSDTINFKHFPNSFPRINNKYPLFSNSPLALLELYINNLRRSNLVFHS